MGFAVAIVLATLLALLARWLGWVEVGDVTGNRPETDFIYSPDRWSFVVAVIAAAAGAVPHVGQGGRPVRRVHLGDDGARVGNVALGLAFGAWDEVVGSGLQLLLNLSGMAVAGWVTGAGRARCGRGCGSAATPARGPRRLSRPG